MFAEVFNELQSEPKVSLKEWAKENPTDFYKLASKLIPVQIGGDPDNPIAMVWQEEKTYEAKP